MGKDIFRSIMLYYLSFLHENDPHCNSYCLLQIMSYKNNCLFELLLNLYKLCLKDLTSEGINSTKGFIHQQNRRISCKSTGILLLAHPSAISGSYPTSDRTCTVTAGCGCFSSVRLK